jgi:hypothetical protein
MKVLPHIALSCLLVIGASVVNAQSPDLDTVLENIIASYGGEENLRKLDSQIQEWSIFAKMGNRHGIDFRTVRIPDQLKVELTYATKKETRIVNGDAGLVAYGNAPARAAVHPQLDAMRLQLMRLYSPLVLRAKLESLSLTVDGEFCVVTLFENGVRVDYVVNMDNWRIEKVVGSLAMQGGEMQFLTEYSDFTFHEGVLIHQSEDKFAGSVNTAVLKLRRITLDADIKDTDFLPSDKHSTQPDWEQKEVT